MMQFCKTTIRVPLMKYRKLPLISPPPPPGYKLGYTSGYKPPSSFSCFLNIKHSHRTLQRWSLWASVLLHVRSDYGDFVLLQLWFCSVLKLKWVQYIMTFQRLIKPGKLKTYFDQHCCGSFWNVCFFISLISPPDIISPSVYKPTHNPLQSCLSPGLISSTLR